MSTADITAINAQFAIPSHLTFRSGPGGLTVAEIANVHATASVALAGGHVLAFQPRNEKPVLWLSPRSNFELGKPIRGGIPVCWPWFGAHPTDKTKPFHGFARISPWCVLGTEALSDGRTRLRLGLEQTDATLALWPHAFRAEITVTVGRDLQVALRWTNQAQESLQYTAALHSYFVVSSIDSVTVHGLEDCACIDTVGTPTRKTQRGPITFAAETDNVYLHTTADCVIRDPGLNRCLRVAKRGSHSAVVWNPWKDKAARLPDLGEGNHVGMLCVETTNAEEDEVTLAPGAEHCLETRLSVEPLR